MPDPRSFSHISEEGKIVMVDVGEKKPTRRRAVARVKVLLSAATLRLLRQQALPKGDALQSAKIAGILAAKRAHELIPLCHPLPLDYVDLRILVDDAACAVVIDAETRAFARTGVEMEALMAAQVAALTVYDMCKAVQKDIVISDCRLIAKSGGKTEYQAE